MRSGDCRSSSWNRTAQNCCRDTDWNNMRNRLIQNLSAILLACLGLILMSGEVAAQDIKSKAAKTVQTGKERLVLMPLRVSDENKNMQAVMETALVQGLQQKYEVFQGEQVSQKAREIFLKESRNQNSKECNEIRCLQNIAEAFQAELIATANVTKIEGGYLLSLNIQNIFDNEAVYSNTLPCRNCDGFQVVENLKLLDNEVAPVATQAAPQAVAPVVVSPASGHIVASENSLWDAAQKNNKLADYQTYLAQYPRGKFASVAEGRINMLEEQAAAELEQQDQNAWSNAINTATEAGYQEYLKHYPRGLYIVQAQARIKKLQDAQHKAADNMKPGREFRDCPECPELVILPAGDFNMGASSGDGDEQPVHHVIIGKVFAMGKTEVTQGQWRALMATSVARNGRRSAIGASVSGLVEKIEKEILPRHRRDATEGHWNSIMETSPEYFKNCGDNCTPEQKRARRESAENGNAASAGMVMVDNNPSYFKNCGDECPVEQVSWEDAQKYIQKLIAKTGKQYRLPSEAEWEYACRGGGANEYCGSDKVENVAWYGGYSTPLGNSGKTTHAVASLRANNFGLYDMSGNVWEWVEDSYHPNYNGAPVDGSTWIDDATKHLLRGGSWSSKPQEVRATQRGKIEPASRGSVGFRVVRVLP